MDPELSRGKLLNLPNFDFLICQVGYTEPVWKGDSNADEKTYVKFLACETQLFFPSTYRLFNNRLSSGAPSYKPNTGMSHSVVET